jgi:hypothetical protein
VGYTEESVDGSVASPSSKHPKLITNEFSPVANYISITGNGQPQTNDKFQDHQLLNVPSGEDLHPV